MGALLHNEHVLIIPSPIVLGDEYTISCRIFSPFFENPKFKTICQGSNGIGGLLVINGNCTQLGTFTIGDEPFYIDSGIKLQEICEKERWYHFAMSYSNKAEIQTDEGTKRTEMVIFYIDGVKTSEVVNLDGHYHYSLGKDIGYIGNSKDFNEPCGFICDFKVVNKFFQFKDKLPDYIINTEHAGITNLFDIFNHLQKDENNYKGVVSFEF